MPNLFEISPHDITDPYDGIDFRQGLMDASGGKVDLFFREVADEYSLNSQQAYARLAIDKTWPHIISTYAANLVQSLHKLAPNRQNKAWMDAREEVEYCQDYLKILSEKPVIALPMDMNPSDGFEPIRWQMMAVPDMQAAAKFYLPHTASFIEYCSDPRSAQESFREILAKDPLISNHK